MLWDGGRVGRILRTRRQPAAVLFSRPFTFRFGLVLEVAIGPIVVVFGVRA